jgi:hypothetical protein
LYKVQAPPLESSKRQPWLHIKAPNGSSLFSPPPLPLLISPRRRQGGRPPGLLAGPWHHTCKHAHRHTHTHAMIYVSSSSLSCRHHACMDDGGRHLIWERVCLGNGKLHAPLGRTARSCRAACHRAASCRSPCC